MKAAGRTWMAVLSIALVAVGSLYGYAAAKAENMALNRPVVASGNEVDWLPPEHAFDGNPGTRWSSHKVDDAWLVLDLGSVQPIDRIVIHWHTPADTYQLLTSQGDGHWTNVLGEDHVIKSQGGVEVIDFELTLARFIKFQGVKRRPASDGHLYGYSFTELEVYRKDELTVVLEVLARPEAVSLGPSHIELPHLPGFQIDIIGSDAPPIIDTTGTIRTPLVDTDVTLLLRVAPEQTESDEGARLVNVAVSVPGAFVQTAERNEEPQVIPSLREWIGGQGYFELRSTARLVVREQDRLALEGVAKVTQADLEELMGLSLPIAYGEPQPGDLYLALDPSLDYLGEQGYLFDVAEHVAISGHATTGVFYGTRTALQILKVEGAGRIPKGTARDYPKYEERGLMIDVARKFFTIDFLRDYVKLLSWYKMNRFQIHLNDDVGTPFHDGTRAAFRLESERYPGLASPNGHYTKEEFRELQRLGMAYGVNVVPEIDTPGHSRAFTQYRPTLGYDRNLNISNPATVEFVKSLFDEYLDPDNPTFIGPDVHIGTDEYQGADNEVFRAYMDELIRYINSKGKHPRLWGGLNAYDGKTPVSTAATMDIWYEPYGAAQHAIDLGYDIVNVHNVMLYIVPRIYRDRLNTQSLYESWEPNDWSSSVLPRAHPKIKGGMFALWNDVSDAKGFSMADAHVSMLPAMQVLAQKMWTGTRDDQPSYAQFMAVADVIGEAPGVNLLYTVDVANSEGLVVRYDVDSGFDDASGNGLHGTGTGVTVAPGRDGMAARLGGSASYIETPVEAVGFGWTLSFWIYPEPGNPHDAVIMESPVGQLKLKQRLTGKLGFTKEHYHSNFDYVVPEGEWTHLHLVGDARGVTLYVNGGEYVESLVPATNTDPIHTLVLPLARIGSATNAFRGMIDSLEVYNRVVEPGGLQNLALGAKVQSSALEVPQFTAESAVDGDASTRWSSSRIDNAWFSVDLGAVRRVSRVTIVWEAAYAKRYRLLASEDGERWTDIVPGGIEGRPGVQRIEFDPVKARYVKFQGVERATQYGYSFYEFEVYGGE